jgi:hypothetical protein
MPRLDPAEAGRIAAAVGVDLESLPPLTQRSRGHVYAVDALPGMDEEDREMMLKVSRVWLLKILTCFVLQVRLLKVRLLFSW